MLNISHYKKVLSQFPTGVCVITTAKEDGLCGITVNSFASVSLDPALILWSVDKSTYSLNYFLNAKKFAISFLNENQQDVSNHFASRGHDDKFQGIDYYLENDLPIIRNAMGVILCHTEKVIEAGDHYIILGAVTKASVPEDDNQKVDALTYYQSGYRKIQ